MNLIKIKTMTFSTEELLLLNKFLIAQTSSIDIVFDTHSLYNIKNFFITIGNDDIISTNMTTLIHRITEEIIAECSELSGIIWLRATVNSSGPFRWHRDGLDFDKIRDKPIYKFALTLRGNSTPVVIDAKKIIEYDKLNKIERRLSSEIFKNLRDKMQIGDVVHLNYKITEVIREEYGEIIGDNYITGNNTGAHREFPDVPSGVYFLNNYNDEPGCIIIDYF